MNFNEKLIKLRKQKGLSQEELGYKLNVTRQTISKWELGQTTPEMEKLIELSKIYGITLDELTSTEENNDTSVNDNIENPIKKEDKKMDIKNMDMRKILVPLLIVLIILALVIGVYKVRTLNRVTNQVVGQSNEIVGESKGIFSFVFNFIKDVMDEFDFNSKTVTDEIKRQMEDNKKNEIKIYNLQFERDSGTQRGNFVSNLLERVVTNNKTQKDHIISVSYKGKNTVVPDEITAIKHQLASLNEYEVSLDYNDEGYVNKITIEDLEKNTFEDMQKNLQEIIE